MAAGQVRQARGWGGDLRCHQQQWEYMIYKSNINTCRLLLFKHLFQLYLALSENMANSNGGLKMGIEAPTGYYYPILSNKVVLQSATNIPQILISLDVFFGEDARRIEQDLLKNLKMGIAWGLGPSLITRRCYPFVNKHWICRDTIQHLQIIYKENNEFATWVCLLCKILCLIGVDHYHPCPSQNWNIFSTNPSLFQNMAEWYYGPLLQFNVQCTNLTWLVVATPLTNISQWEGLSHILWKIKTCSKPPTSHSCCTSCTRAASTVTWFIIGSEFTGGRVKESSWYTYCNVMITHIYINRYMWFDPCSNFTCVCLKIWYL